MDLFLVRHGKAVDASPAVDDADRPLTTEGIEEFTAAAEGLARMVKSPTRWFVSPLRRARETALILEEAMDFEGKMKKTDALVPEADPMEILGELSDSTDDAVLIGHEPHLGSLLGLILTGRQGVSIPLKKGMVVGVRLDHPGTLPGRLFFALSEKIASRIVES